MLHDTEEEVETENKAARDARLAFELLLTIVGAKRLNQWLEKIITDLLNEEKK